jgi:hypothetical protein
MYHPSLDPNLSRSLDAISYYGTSGFVDCRIFNVIQENLKMKSNIIYYNNSKFRIIKSNSLNVTLNPGNRYTIDFIKITAKGTLSKTRVNLQVTASNSFSSYSTTLYLDRPGVAESDLLALISDNGILVHVKARVSCSAGACVFGLRFVPEKPAIFTGYADASMSLKYDSGLANCNFARFAYIVPSIISEISNYTATVQGTCTIYHGSHVNIKGSAKGNFIALKGIILAISTTSPGYGFALNATVGIKEVVSLNISNITVSLPVDEAIQFKSVNIKAVGNDGASQAILNFFKDRGVDTYLRAYSGNVTFLTSIISETRVFPFNGFKYEIIYDARKISLPYMTAINVSYTYSKNKVSSYLTKYTLKWRFRSVQVPEPLNLIYPRLIIIKHLATNESYLIVIERGLPLYVSHVMAENESSLITVISNMSLITSDPLRCTDKKIYLFKLIGELSDSLSVKFSIYIDEYNGIYLGSYDTIGYITLNVNPGVYILTVSPLGLNVCGVKSLFMLSTILIIY